MIAIRRVIWVAVAILFFLFTSSLASPGLQLSSNDSSTDSLVQLRLGSGFSALEGNPVPDYMGLSQAGLPALLDVATIYTNLTASVFLLAEVNNTLLNVKGHLWIVAHVNLTVDMLGFIPAGTHLHTHRDNLRGWLNFTTDLAFYSVRIRSISSAAEIPEILDDVNTYVEYYSFYTVMTYIMTALIGGAPGMWVFGRWRMRTK